MLKINLSKKGVKVFVILALVLILFSFLAIEMLWKNKGNLGADFVAQKFRHAVKSNIGVDVIFSSISGNPLVGYVGKDVKLDIDGNITNLAKSINIKPSLRSLLARKPRVTSIDINSARIASEDALKLFNLPLTDKEPKQSISIENISFYDTEILGKRRIYIERAHLKPEDNLMEFDVHGAINLLKFQAKGRLSASNGRVSLEDCLIKTNEGNGVLEGEITPLFSLRGELHNISTDEIAAMFPGFTSTKPKGTISGSISFTMDEKRSLKIDGQFYLPSGEIVGIPLNDTSFTLLFSNGVLDFKVLQNKSFESEVTGSVMVFFNPLRLKLELKSKVASIEAWKNRFDWLSPLSGTAENIALSLEGPPKYLSGRVKFGSPELKIMNLALTNADMTAEVSGSQICFNGKGFWKDILLELQGATSHDGSPMLDATITARSVDAKNLKNCFKDNGELEVEGNCDIFLSVHGKAGSLAFEGIAQADQLKAGYLNLKDLKAEFALQKGNLNIATLHAKLNSADLNGKGIVSDIFSSNPTFGISGVIRNLELGEIFDSTNTRISGESEIEWKITRSGADTSLTAHINAPLLCFDDLLSLTDMSVAVKSVKNGLFLSGESLCSEGRIDFEGNITFANNSPLMDISGKMTNIKLESPDFALDGTIRGDFQITGHPGKLTLSSEVISDDITMRNIPLKNFIANVEVRDSFAEVRTLSFDLWEGIVMLKGTAQKDALDLNGQFNAINLSHLPLPPKWFPQGLAGGMLEIRGNIASPQITVDGIMKEAAIGGLSFDKINFLAKSDMTNFKVDYFEACSEEGVLKGELEGTFKPRPSLKFDLHGKKLPTSMLAHLFSPNLKNALQGLVQVNLKGEYKDTLTVRGNIDADELLFFGLKIQKASIPIQFTGDAYQIGDLRAKISGGTLQMHLTAKRNRPLQWKTMISLEDVPLEFLLQDFLKEAYSVCGSANLYLDLKGEGARLVNMSGLGKLEITDGQILAFQKPAKTLEELGIEGFKFHRALLNFNINGPSVYILPGSMITSHPDDSLYRYISFDGVIASDGKIDLFCLGNVNAKALNALTKALKEVAALENPTEQEIAQNLLKGLIGGFSVKDFKDVSLRIKGTWPSVTLSKLSVGEPSLGKDTTSHRLNGDEDEWNVNLFFAFPTGDGSSPDYDFGDQFISQLLQGLLDQLFSPASHDNEKKGTFSTVNEFNGSH